MRILTIVLILVSGLAFAQQTQQTQEISHGEYDAVAQQIEKKILENDKVKIEDFKVLHKGDTVYLEGIVDLCGSYYVAQEVASNFKGIKHVDNQIGVRNKDISDLDLQYTLFARVQRHLPPEPFDLVSIKVTKGFVTLSGVVRDYTLKEDAFNEAIWVSGVRAVENKIQLASLSETDDRLRVFIFQYLRPTFPQYFGGPHPSIVILVDHGRVTLVGHVNSEVDKKRMLSGIRSVSGVLSVEDQLATD